MGALFIRDFKLGIYAGNGAFLAILFFLTIITVVPFAVGPDLKLLARIGPAMLWIGALLATLLGLDRLFQSEREDGSLDILLMQDTPLFLIVLVKCGAHWAATGLPLVLASPFLGILMNMSLLDTGAAALTLFVGTPAITFIGSLGAALAVSLPRGGLLVSILILPLVIPVLIFGISAIYGAVEEPAPFTAPFLILCAITLAFSIIGPMAAAATLRASAD